MLQQYLRGYLKMRHNKRLPAVHAALLTLTAVALSACSTKPISPYSEEGVPLVLVPASQAGVLDKRGRFREIFCKVLEERSTTLPDYRSCDDALTKVGEEPGASGNRVRLGSSGKRLVAVLVPGIGWNCFSEWLNPTNSVGKHIRRFGYDLVTLNVDSMSGVSKNARQIRDAIMQMPTQGGEPRVVLIGYSKGAPDILEAVATYPELRKRVAAVVSAGGAVGGSALANDAKQSQLELLKHWPGAHCTPGDGGAIESLRPATRKAWLAENPLPRDIPYYSLVNYPKPERISSVLKPSYNKLSRIDARNDSQVLFYDQVIPGSTLMGYLNADHWALAVPIARTHSTLGSIFVDQNDYPREALTEALLRFVEEDLIQ
jgi:pimeloyl-ACP methyl ester carboxylesterase